MELLKKEPKPQVMPKIDKSLPPQEALELFIREAIAIGKYQNVFLFSEDGLLLAGDHTKSNKTQDLLIEITGILRDIKTMAENLGGIQNLKEIAIEGENYKRIIFRFFNAFQQSVALAAIVPERTSYRGITNRLVRTAKVVSSKL